MSPKALTLANKICLCLTCGKGAYVVRAVHVTLTCAVPGSLIFVAGSDLYTWLRNFEDHIVACSVYGGVFLASIMFYFAACFTDPGYVTTASSDFADSESEEVDDSDSVHVTSDSAAILASSPLKHCDACNIQQPLRSRHCEDCKRCVRKFDHHCPWLAACVGERNHKFFVMFLLFMTVLIWWTSAIAVRAFPSRNLDKKWGGLEISYAGIIFADMVINVIAGLTVSGLLAFHLYLMCTNQTTWESASRNKISYLKNLADDFNPFDLGCCRNSYTFCCRCAPYQWLPVYAKSSSQISLNNV